MDVETFWRRYDWTTPEAQKHLQVVPKEHKIRKVIKVDEDKTDNKPVDNGGEVVEKTKDASYQYPITVEWTREGVEEVLSTVGITVGYNTAVSVLHVRVRSVLMSSKPCPVVAGPLPPDSWS